MATKNMVEQNTHSEGFKYFANRYLDTVVYILMLLCLATLVVKTVALETEVHQMRNEIASLREEIAIDIAVAEKAEEETDVLPAEDNVAADYPRLYSDEDAIALAKLAWGEARGVPILKINGRCVSTKAQQAAVMWTVLNRFDAGYKDSIMGVITAKGQFHGYSASYPVEEELLGLAYDVLNRWNAEKHGETVIRELPAGYLWFGGDGTYNWFRDAYKGGNRWTWE